jgi:exodeoxyribonuclease V beta subunit
MFDEAGVHARLLELPDGERRLTNLLHLAELLQDAARDGHLGPVLLVQWLNRVRSDPSLSESRAGDAAQLRLESDLDAVKVSTIHKSKGLEYPIVYCPFLWDGRLLFGDDQKWVRFHDAASANRLSLDIGSDAHSDHVKVAEREALAEGLRLLYVALTRAKHRCTVVWGRFNGAETSALAYLLHQPDDAEEAGLVQAVAGRYKKMDASDLGRELEALAEASGGAIGIRPMNLEPGSPYARTSGQATLSKRNATRRLATRWRHSSFSSLTRKIERAPSRGDHPGDEGFDFDALSESADSLAPLEASAEIRLRDFPKGAAAGTLIHSILEQHDFQDPGSLDALAEEALKQGGMRPGLAGVLCESLLEVLRTPWSAASDAPRLDQLPREKRLDELEFLIPVAHAGDAERALTVNGLAEVFVNHAASEAIRHYGETLRELRFHPLEGFLKGFIDLVFEWNGRFHVVDYKSNHLGPQTAQYAPDELRGPMVEHHYVLQYHLYLVALHRYLAQRLPGYDYDTHIGGAWYLFLRGMAPANPAGCGVYHDRPPRALIEALSALLAAPAEARTIQGGEDST